jgi:cytochrome c-type biogenesis protein CcmH
MISKVQTLSEQLQRLRAAHASGALAEADYSQARAPLERQLVDLLIAEPLPAAPRRLRPWLGAGLGGVLLLAVAAGGTWWTRTPAPMVAAPAAAASAAAPGQEQIVAMVEGLAARLKQQPDDAAGWAMLGRSYMALNRPADALAAYRAALKLKPKDAGALADVADLLALTQGSQLDGEPTRLIEQALAIDPDHLKALALAGAAAYNRGDFKAAVRHWDRVVSIGPADNPMVEQARQGALSARQLGKLPEAPAATAPSPAAPAAGR